MRRGPGSRGPRRGCPCPRPYGGARASDRPWWYLARQGLPPRAAAALHGTWHRDLGAHMRAAFLYGAGDVRVDHVAEPTIVEPTDAVVRIVRACVCGSDLHRYHDLPASSTGRAMGHELIGVVEEVGRDVVTVRKGDFVISSFAIQDNTCAFCRDGFQTACVHGRWFGSGGVGGAQAEAVRIPLADGTLVKPGITLDDADDAMLASLLTLSGVFLTGHHA